MSHVIIEITVLCVIQSPCECVPSWLVGEFEEIPKVHPHHAHLKLSTSLARTLVSRSVRIYMCIYVCVRVEMIEIVICSKKGKFSSTYIKELGRFINIHFFAVWNHLRIHRQVADLKESENM